MKFIHDDGGRAAAGFRGATGDCATRAIAIASGRPYAEVYDALNDLAKRERPSSRRRRSSARTGVHRATFDRYLRSLGAVWTPTMQIGSGCTVHLRDGELPPGRLIVRLAKHWAAVIDGVLHDTHDSSAGYDLVEYREGYSNIPRHVYRCVYGYWRLDVPKKEIGTPCDPGC